MYILESSLFGLDCVVRAAKPQTLSSAGCPAAFSTTALEWCLIRRKQGGFAFYIFLEPAATVRVWVRFLDCFLLERTRPLSFTTDVRCGLKNMGQFMYALSMLFLCAHRSIPWVLRLGILASHMM